MHLKTNYVILAIFITLSIIYLNADLPKIINKIK